MSDRKDKKKSLNPFSSDECCHICKSSFGVNKPRKTCAFCNELVCKEHSVKKEWDGQKKRMCDTCRYGKIRLQVVKSVSNEINELQATLAEAEAERDKYVKEIEEMDVIADVKRSKINTGDMAHLENICDLESRIGETVHQNERTEFAITNLKTFLEESQEKCDGLNKRISDVDREVKQYEFLKDRVNKEIQSLLGNVKKVKNVMNKSITPEQLIPIICEECNSRLFHSGAKKK